MDFPAITHHGGVHGITGSCHQLHLDDGASLLVDCGMAQGADARLDVGPGELGFGVGGVLVLVVTHVHLDHVGRIPTLFGAGFRGPILCSEPSAKLLPLVLEDAYRLEISNEPVQVQRFLALLERHIEPIPFAHWHVVIDRPGLYCAIRLQRAGHLLGSAYVECEVRRAGKSTRVVFSGDLGASGNPLLRPLEPPEWADVLVLESTYGDRLHVDRGERRQQLEALIERALRDQGAILIPAFSLGRTQELLCELEDILYRKALFERSEGAPGGEFAGWARLPVILDSPLALRITQVYRELHMYWREEARQRLVGGRDPLGFGQLVTIESHSSHQRVVNYLKSTGRPAIVIAGNGMCSGGRIVDYLKAMLGDPRHEVLFVGYQAKGTPGAVIQASRAVEDVGQVDLSGQLYQIRAKVLTLGGFSGHADQRGLLAFAQGCAAKRVLLVHGERASKQALAQVLRQELPEGSFVAVAGHGGN
ncbi:MBL fold metallo-hydrolase [Pseudomonas xantholysinigenes]|uniref:MBL fold metallo-hydrolase n=1 Tax=Pseudomonas xantholysinigenes TaxID=2745490 RepID=A0A9E6PZ24_9PSED|nr:MBL fold metallo-hydrolase [Pseudomonas xantholysinigenes]QXI39794.1 MBL fold metallo-hydrolase [Pseudomonas xantholysinigenes]